MRAAHFLGVHILLVAVFSIHASARRIFDLLNPLGDAVRKTGLALDDFWNGSFGLPSGVIQRRPSSGPAFTPPPQQARTGWLGFYRKSVTGKQAIVTPPALPIEADEFWFNARKSLHNLGHKLRRISTQIVRPVLSKLLSAPAFSGVSGGALLNELDSDGESDDESAENRRQTSDGSSASSADGKGKGSGEGKVSEEEGKKDNHKLNRAENGVLSSGISDSGGALTWHEIENLPGIKPARELMQGLQCSPPVSFGSCALHCLELASQPASLPDQLLSAGAMGLDSEGDGKNVKGGIDWTGPLTRPEKSGGGFLTGLSKLTDMFEISGRVSDDGARENPSLAPASIPKGQGILPRPWDEARKNPHEPVSDTPADPFTEREKTARETATPSAPSSRARTTRSVSIDLEGKKALELCVSRVCYRDYLSRPLPGCLNELGALVPPATHTHTHTGISTPTHTDENLSTEISGIDHYDASKLIWMQSMGAFRLLNFADNFLSFPSLLFKLVLLPLYALILASLVFVAHACFAPPPTLNQFPSNHNWGSTGSLLREDAGNEKSAVSAPLLFLQLAAVRLEMALQTFTIALDASAHAVLDFIQTVPGTISRFKADYRPINPPNETYIELQQR